METELETDREAEVVREEEGTAEGEREPGTISSAGNEDKEAKKEPEKVSSTLSVVSQISLRGGIKLSALLDPLCILLHTCIPLRCQSKLLI